LELDILTRSDGDGGVAGGGADVADDVLGGGGDNGDESNGLVLGYEPACYNWDGFLVLHVWGVADVTVDCEFCVFSKIRRAY